MLSTVLPAHSTEGAPSKALLQPSCRARWEDSEKGLVFSALMKREKLLSATWKWVALMPMVTRSSPRPGRRLKVRSARSEEHTSELQSRPHLVCRLLLEKKNRSSANM